jgi:TatD DNase family protein
MSESLRSFVDFHCHLDLYPNHSDVIAECERAGVFTLGVTTTPKAWPRNNDLARATRHVRAALGLHPQLVSARAHELSIWEAYLPQARYIGEVGLDAGPRFYQSLELQKTVFASILKSCSSAGGKVLTIHSVRAVRPVLDMIEAHFPCGRGKAVLHWFTGTKSEARRAVDLGCFFSINSEMLKNDRHSAVVTTLPSDRLLTETDGPFVQVNGRPIRPADVQSTVEALARMLAVNVADLAATIKGNLKRLVSE